MRPFLIVSTLAALLLAGCTDPKQERVNALKDEAIEIHDEVMPRIGEINTLSIDIKKMSRAFESDTSAEADAMKAEAMDLVKQLDEAHNGMMDWMAAYEPAYESGHPIDSAIRYYENEKRRITRVKEDMENSIEDGKRWMEKRGESR